MKVHMVSVTRLMDSYLAEVAHGSLGVLCHSFGTRLPGNRVPLQISTARRGSHAPTHQLTGRRTSAGCSGRGLRAQSCLHCHHNSKAVA